MDNTTIAIILSVIGVSIGLYGIRRSTVSDRKMGAHDRDVQELLQGFAKVDEISRKRIQTKEDDEYLKLYVQEIGDLFVKHPEWATGKTKSSTYGPCGKCGSSVKEIATFPRPNVPKAVTPVKVHKCPECGHVYVTWGWQ